MNESRKFQRTTLLCIVSLSFLVGLALSRKGGGLDLAWLLFAGTATLLTFRRKDLTSIVSCVLLGIVLGIARGDAFMQRLVPYEQLYGAPVVLEVEAINDGVYGDDGQLEFDGANIKAVTPTERPLPGRVRVNGRGEPAIFRGDIVVISGTMFPSGGSRQARMSYASIEVIGRSGLWTEKTRREFVAGMQTAIPEPQASFGLGLLVGQRSTLPDDVSEQLAVAGLTHIIAVSGYNLTIIVRGVRRLLGKRSKYQSTVLAVLLIVGFLLFTGFSASIVRAAIVSLLSISAWYYGRAFKPVLLLSFTAAITAAWNPLYVWSDIGWYLSFLAFFGVLIVAPLIKRRVTGNKESKFLGQVILESISAQVMTAPLILYIFGETSLIALVSNALIVPLVPFAMLFSLIGGLAGMLVPAISGIIAWPATVLMTYMLDMVALFAKVPGALLEFVLPLKGMVFGYGVLLVGVVLMHRKLKAKYGTITEKSIIE
jgi:competence protein ComEC